MPNDNRSSAGANDPQDECALPESILCDEPDERFPTIDHDRGTVSGRSMAEAMNRANGVHNPAAPPTTNRGPRKTRAQSEGFSDGSNGDRPSLDAHSERAEGDEEIPNWLFDTIHVDGLELSLWGRVRSFVDEETGEVAHTPFMESLEWARAEAQDSDSGSGEEVKITLDLEGETVELMVKPHGASQGRYRICAVGKELAIIAGCKASPEHMPQVRLRFGARWWWTHSTEETAQWVQALAEHMGLDLTQPPQIARVDVKLDRPEQMPETMLNGIRGTGPRNGAYSVHRSRGTYTGVSASTTTGLHWTVYDKIEEIRRKKLDHYAGWFRQNGVDVRGEDAHIWRIEAAFRRRWLKKQDIPVLDFAPNKNDIDRGGLDLLWSYFTTHYLRFTHQPTSEVRSRDAVPHPWWFRAQDASARRGETFDRDRTRSITTQPDALLQQAVGCLASYVARSGAQAATDWVRATLDRLPIAVAKKLPEKVDETIEDESAAVERFICETLDDPAFGDTYVEEQVMQRVRDTFTNRVSDTFENLRSRLGRKAAAQHMTHLPALTW